MTNTDVVKKIIGEVHPYGASHIDGQRLENLKSMCVLVEDLVHEIEKASESKDRPEKSMKEIGLYAEDFLKLIGLREPTQ